MFSENSSLACHFLGWNSSGEMKAWRNTLCLRESHASSTFTGWCIGIWYHYFHIGTAIAVCSHRDWEFRLLRSLVMQWYNTTYVGGCKPEPKTAWFLKILHRWCLYFCSLVGLVAMCWIFHCRQSKKIFFSNISEIIWSTSRKRDTS